MFWSNYTTERLGKTSWQKIMAWGYLLLVLGLLIWVGLVFDWQAVHIQATQWSHAWWLVPALILAQALPFAFALPGSLMFVVIGLLYDPFPATLMIATGGVLGSTAAYFISGRVAFGWVLGLQHQRIYQLLQRNTNFLMLCAMRTFPGFPHSVINFGSGMLRVPLRRFVPSTILGYLVKGMLYASIVNNVMEAEEVEDFLTMDVMWPLVLLAGLFVMGFVIQKILGNSQSAD